MEKGVVRQGHENHCEAGCGDATFSTILMWIIFLFMLIELLNYKKSIDG